MLLPWHSDGIAMRAAQDMRRPTRPNGEGRMPGQRGTRVIHGLLEAHNQTRLILGTFDLHSLSPA